MSIAAWATSSISRDGSCSSSTASCTFSATATNSVKIVFAYDNGSTTIPTLPAGWTTITSFATAAGGTPAAVRVGCNVSSSGADTGTGTWTNATNVAGLSYSGALSATTANCNVNAVGGFATASAKASVSMNYATVTMVNSDGGSWAAGFAGDSAGGICAPSGMTQQSTSGSGPAIIVSDTTAGTASWTSTSCSISSGTWATAVIEVLGHVIPDAQAPTIDNPGQTTNTATNPVDIGSFAVGSCSNRLLVACTQIYNSTTDISVTSVTWDQAGTNQALTLLTRNACAHTSAGFVTTECWYLKAPPNATKSIHFVYGSAPTEFVEGAMSFCGVDQTTPLGTAATACGDSSHKQPTVTVTSSTTALTMDVVAFDTFNLTASPNGVLNWNVNTSVNGTAGESQYEAGQASQAMAWRLTNSGTANWSQIGFGVNGISAALNRKTVRISISE